MPYNLVFSLSEKAIIDRDEGGAASLISLVSGISISVPADEKIEQNSVIPLKIAATVLWLKLPEDEEKEYEQKVEVIFPDDTLKGFSVIRFKMERRTHTTVTRFDKYPVGMLGIHKIRLSIREVKPDIEEKPEDWKFIADYPLEITLQPQEDEANKPAQEGGQNE